MVSSAPQVQGYGLPWLEPLAGARNRKGGLEVDNVISTRSPFPISRKISSSHLKISFIGFCILV